MADVIILTGGSVQDEWVPRIRRHLGAYRVSSELKKQGYDCVVIDYIQYMTTEEILNAISKHISKDTLWVGFSSTFFYTQKSGVSGIEKLYQNMPYDTMKTIYKHVRDNSSAKIVYGGAYALFPHVDPLVDYYVAGYSDVSIVNLTDSLAGKSELLHYKEFDIDGSPSILIDSGSYPSPEMDKLQTFWNDPSYNLLPQEPVPLEFARGCIFKCKFCNYPLLGKKKGTYIRDMEQIKDEIIMLWETHGTDTFYMTDDTFNDDNDKMIEFHKMSTSLPFKPKFSAFLRLDLINKFPEQADMLLEAGMVGTFFGIESFNWKSAKAIGKGMHPDKVKSRLNWVADKWKGRVNIGVGLILGLPYDDMEYFQELHRYITSGEYPAHHTVFNPLYIFDRRRGVNMYGSEFSLNPEVYGYDFDENGMWFHAEQKLDFQMCRNLANEFTNITQQTAKIAEFRMTQYLGIGVKLEDLLTKSDEEITMMYDIPSMNREKLLQYKQMIGAI